MVEEIATRLMKWPLAPAGRDFCTASAKARIFSISFSSLNEAFPTPAWMIPANLYIRSAMRRYTTTTEGLDRPWDILEALVPELGVEPLLLGGAYVASGPRPVSARA